MKREVYAMLSAAVLACGVAHAQPQAAASGAAPGQAVKPGQVVPVAGGAPATASVVPAPMAPALSAEEAAYLNEEAALVRKLRLTQLQAQLAEQERKLRGEEAEKPDSASLPPILPPPALATGPMQQQLPSPMAEVPPPAQESLLFRLVGIWGADGALQADVVSQGMRVTVREGDALPGGWKVARIARTGMLIQRGKSSRLLMLGG